jgi:hypothetical protein
VLGQVHNPTIAPSSRDGVITAEGFGDLFDSARALTPSRRALPPRRS